LPIPFLRSFEYLLSRTVLERPRTDNLNGTERVNDFETPAERIECRRVVQVCERLADLREG
jgi:hypothetical protein